MLSNSRFHTSAMTPGPRSLQALLGQFLDELCGDSSSNSSSRQGGALLRQLPVPAFLVGRTYRDLFEHMTKTVKAVPLGLYR